MECTDNGPLGHLVFGKDIRIDALSIPFVVRVSECFHGTDYHLSVNCAYRDSAEDRRKGRSGTSYHCQGRALDLSMRGLSGFDRYNIVLRLMNAGLTVGIYKTFIHVDDRDNPILFYGE